VLGGVRRELGIKTQDRKMHIYRRPENKGKKPLGEKTWMEKEGFANKPLALAREGRDRNVGCVVVSTGCLLRECGGGLKG